MQEDNPKNECSENPLKNDPENASKTNPQISQKDMFIKELFSKHADVILESVETAGEESEMDSKPRRVALYCRVSTDDQTIENQLQELRVVAERHNWIIDEKHVYKDEAISGSKGRDKRPGFEALHIGIHRKEFDLVAAWSVDRLGRSLSDLLAFLGDMESKGVDLYLHQQSLDTSTPSGKAMFQMMGVFSQFERAMIQERVKAGLKRAKSQGKVLGRPKVSQEIEQAIIAAKATGKGIRKIAAEVGTSPATVIRILDQAGVEREIRKRGA